MNINPEAIKRENVNADGTIWCRGQIVDANDENVHMVITSAEEAVDFHTERLTIINENPDGLSPALLTELFGVDHRYHNSSPDQLASMLRNKIGQSKQYIADIREANYEFNGFPTLRNQRCDECNELIVWHSRGVGYETFKTCKNRTCSEYMLTAPTRASDFEIQDDGAGNQITADGRTLR